MRTVREKAQSMVLHYMCPRIVHYVLGDNQTSRLHAVADYDSDVEWKIVRYKLLHFPKVV